MIVRRYGPDVGLIALALVLQVVPIDARWLENGYANGIYPALARTFVPLANAVPVSLGDCILIAILGGLGVYWIAGWRRYPDPAVRRLARIALRTAAVAAVAVLWFDAAWALNYRRVPIVGRIAYNRARVSPQSVSAFSATIVRQLNATVLPAHADVESENVLEARLANAFEPVVRRLGDRYDVKLSRPKQTIFDRWFGMAGIGGQWDPFAYETLLNGNFLPFERPFALAHEWGHVAGFGDESDANLIAALTTLRSGDPLIRYSGLFWAYGFLPDADRERLPISPLVRADLNAARTRFLRYYDPRVFVAQWFVYDKFLRANRVAAGVVSYSLFVQVLVGTPLDREGLPQLRPERGRE